MGAARKVLEPVRTVAVVSSCTSATYWPFLVPWAQRVAALTRTPDEIVVATDAPEYARAAVDELLEHNRRYRERVFAAAGAGPWSQRRTA